MERDNKYVGVVWKEWTKISNETLENFDFSYTNFNCAIFENIVFKNCLFFKSDLDNTRVYYDSYFENCEFINVNLRNTTVGSSKGGVYKNCLFEKCKLTYRFSTKFIDCTFKIAKMKGIDFCGSTFNNCKFIGKLEDVSFNGIYETNPDPLACLKNVDFSQAVFGEFVTFYNCDLSTCIPPSGSSFNTLLYESDSKRNVWGTESKDGVIL